MRRLRRTSTWLSSIALCFATRAHAQQHTNLSTLEFLVGRCWVGTMADGKTTDTHCFDWMLGKKFVRDRHVVSSTPPYEGETVYSFDAVEKTVEFRYWSNDGLVLDGTVLQKGNELVFPGHYADEKGATVQLRAVWTRLGDSAYRAVQSTPVGDTWKPVMTVEYHRKAARE